MRQTTSNETGILFFSCAPVRPWKRSIRSAVQVRCAGTNFNSGFSMNCRSQLRRSNMPPQAETIGRILSDGLCVFGRP